MGMDYLAESEELGVSSPETDILAGTETDILAVNSFTSMDGGGDRGGGGQETEGEEGELSGGQTRGRRAPRTYTGNMEQDKILCRICGDSAVRHIHYGGHCCFSCKAFFRRAVHHQTKTGRSFKCKFDGSCEINIKNRKTCQSCRFKKCVGTGMNPSWVLSDDQRKKRFKKYREQKGINENGDLSSPDSLGNEFDDNQPPHFPSAGGCHAERNSGRRRVKSAPDRGTPLGACGENGGRGRGSRKYGNKTGGGVGRNGGLGLHCGNGNSLATASQPVSPVDSICSIDFGHCNNSWTFPDVVKSEPLDDNYSTAYNSLKQDVQNGFVTSPVKLEPDTQHHQVYNNSQHHHQHNNHHYTTNNLNVDLMDNRVAIKEEDERGDGEVDMNNELDMEQLDKLQALIASVDFNSLVDIEPEQQKSEEATKRLLFSPSVENSYQPHLNTHGHMGHHEVQVNNHHHNQSDQVYNSSPSSSSYPVTPDPEPRLAPTFPLNAPAEATHTSLLHNGLAGLNGYAELSQEDVMSIMKLEMSFENSNCSFPLMSEETSSIWDSVIMSCNFNMLSNCSSSATNILNEAVELCLKRNLIFLQENCDFTSLSLETRTQLYINNMGSMCHVRGLLCAGGTAAAARQQSAVQSRQAFGSNFTLSSQADNSVQISYKDQRTGKLRLWKIESGFGDMGLGGMGGAPARDDKNLLDLAEQIMSLELGMVPYIIMLLMVLFSSQGCNTLYSGIVDSLQNKYLSLMYRYLQSTYDQPRAKKFMTVLMKFVISLLSKAY